MSLRAQRDPPPSPGVVRFARAVRPLAPLAVQLFLAVLVVSGLRIEPHRGLASLLALAAGGGLIRRLLPPAWRPTWFLGVSLAALPLMLGWVAAAWVVGLVLPLVAACHLPVAWWLRAATVAALGGGMVIARAGSTAAFWPIVGSILMFRLCLYLRGVGREREPTPWSRRLSYFFLLPNAGFAFFPIVDYRTFCDSYDDDDSGEAAQRGVRWMLHGIVHLLLYRGIKAFLLPAPIDLIDLETAMLFVVTNYALYLRISGCFHIIVGMLHLHGFRLPRTHDRYFLASSFVDIWRRINIYWKDFLSTQVFYPAFFAGRRLPKGVALVAAVAATFVATWLLHSWQAFWLLGRFPLDVADAVLWLSAGGLVAVNAVLEYRAVARGPGDGPPAAFAAALRTAVQVVATFLAVAGFWACWTIPEFPRLLAGIAATGGVRPHGIALVAAAIAGSIAAGTAVGLVRRRWGGALAARWEPFLASPAGCILPLAALAMLGLPEFQRRLPLPAARLVAAFAHDPPGPEALGEEVMGYYEQLAGADRQARPLLDRGGEPAGRTRDYWEASRDRPDLVGRELVPGWSGEVEGFPFQVNRWGMRDDDLPRRKPPGTWRIAVLGSSVTMGYGVAADVDFESLVEAALDEAAGPAGTRVELLNFGVGGHFALNAAALLRDRVWGFDPDVVMYVAHQGEYYGPPRHLANACVSGYRLPYPCLDGILTAAGVTRGTSQGVAERLLQRQAADIVSCVYRGIVEDCRRRGVAAAWVYVPIPGVEGVEIDVADLVARARQAGFVVIDLSGWADGLAPADVKLGPQNLHLDARGHRLVADRLREAVRSAPELLPPAVRGE